MNTNGFILMFLEETISRENNVNFLKSIQVENGENWALKEEEKFFIRSYRSEINGGHKWKRMVKVWRSQEKASVKCQEKDTV